MALPNEVESYTLADALTWDEQGRMELIHGTPVMMAPPTRAHQRAVSEFNRQLGNYLQDKRCEVYPAPFAVRLFEQTGDRPEDVDTLVEPDISVICDLGKLDDMGCKGAPDLIIEILSPSTQRHDRMVKFQLYQQAGVREYWIADCANQGVQVFTLEGGRYVPSDFGTAKDQLRVNVLEGCVIDLSRVFPDDSVR